MSKFQIFYDYECPFCKKGYEDLMYLLPAYPGMEIDWRPIEAHPRPENVWPHTDLCIESFYIAVEQGADLDAFNRAMFHAAAIERRDVEKGEILAEILKGIVEGGKFLESLKSRKYAFKVSENNNLAYEEKEVWYVPAFRVPEMGLQAVPRLDARGGTGVSREEIRKFLDKLGGKLNN